MKITHLATAFLFLISLPALVFAGYNDEINEVIAGNSFGFSAKQMAMGGAGMMSMDGTALFYNPANLARVPRIEMNVGLSFQKYNNKSVLRTFGQSREYPADDSKNNTRLNSMILTIPYPTWRGSLVFGLGMARPVSFDRASKMHYENGSSFIDEETFESGGLNNYSFGFGIDLSPRLAFGGALILYKGKHKLNLAYDYNALAADTTVYQMIDSRYLGVGLRLGMAMQMSRHFGFGITAELPATLNIKQDEYNLSRPYSFSFGAIGRFNNLTLMADADYTDWTQLAYEDSKDLETKYNHLFKEYYRDVLKLKLGAEYIFPAPGLSLRAGYYYDPVPFRDRYLDALKTYDGNAQNGLSCGFGILIDEVMTFDFAFVHGSYDENYLYALDGFPDYIAASKETNYNRIFVTGSYRF
jgi:hypothetical protein